MRQTVIAYDRDYLFFITTESDTYTNAPSQETMDVWRQGVNTDNMKQLVLVPTSYTCRPINPLHFSVGLSKRVGTDFIPQGGCRVVDDNLVTVLPEAKGLQEYFCAVIEYLRKEFPENVVLLNVPYCAIEKYYTEIDGMKGSDVKHTFSRSIVNALFEWQSRMKREAGDAQTAGIVVNLGYDPYTQWYAQEKIKCE